MHCLECDLDFYLVIFGRRLCFGALLVDGSLIHKWKLAHGVGIGTEAVGVAVRERGTPAGNVTGRGSSGLVGFVRVFWREVLDHFPILIRYFRPRELPGANFTSISFLVARQIGAIWGPKLTLRSSLTRDKSGEYVSPKTHPVPSLKICARSLSQFRERKLRGEEDWERLT